MDLLLWDFCQLEHSYTRIVTYLVHNAHMNSTGPVKKTSLGSYVSNLEGSVHTLKTYLCNGNIFAQRIPCADQWRTYRAGVLNRYNVALIGKLVLLRLVFIV